MSDLNQVLSWEMKVTCLGWFWGEYIGLWHFCQPPLPNVSTTIVTQNDNNEDDDNKRSFNWKHGINKQSLAQLAFTLHGCFWLNKHFCP